MKGAFNHTVPVRKWMLPGQLTRWVGVLALLFSFSIQSCQPEPSENIPEAHSADTLAEGSGIASDQPKCKELEGKQVIRIEGIAVEIRVPNGQVIGDLLVLPGWNFPRDEWCNRSSLCRKALRKGYRLIMPEMGKSIYASRYYPESRQDWTVYPTRTWLTDQMIPELQETYCLLQPGSKNFLLGLSTGGRGVALVAVHTGNLFAAGAALSGDYDQTLIPRDNLMRGIYGEYKSFPERWEGEDNPAKMADRIQVPLYLGHGKKDNVVPWTQTQHFAEVLRKAAPNLKVKLNLPQEQGHDFAYWNAEVSQMLEFFDEYHKTMPESSGSPQ